MIKRVTNGELLGAATAMSNLKEVKNGDFTVQFKYAKNTFIRRNKDSLMSLEDTVKDIYSEFIDKYMDLHATYDNGKSSKNFVYCLANIVHLPIITPDDDKKLQFEGRFKGLLEGTDECEDQVDEVYACEVEVNIHPINLVDLPATITEEQMESINFLIREESCTE